MKKRILLAGLFVVLLCLLVWWMLHLPKGKEGPASVGRMGRKEEAMLKNGRSLTEAERTESINKWETHRESLIEFWGKVVDQNDAPIEGVRIKSSIVSHKIALPGTALRKPYYYGTTDSGGSFHIKTDHGRIFTIESMEKEGYVLSPDLRGRSDNLYIYNYDNAKADRFRPDSSKPVIFKLWKMTGAEPMVECEKTLIIPYDGTPILVDLQ